MTLPIIFLGNGRCYHTVDWFRSAQAINPKCQPILITDLIEGESFEKLIKSGDQISKLLIIDKFLFKKQSRFGDVWRNIIKLLLLPIQIIRLRKLLKNYTDPVIHAHSMYYIALARLSSHDYIATPQGSEILVRPYKSIAYKTFTRFALSRARKISVDSEQMKGTLFSLFGIESQIIQNGIDIEAIASLRQPSSPRTDVLSIRGIAPNYQAKRLIDIRNATLPDLPIHFCYPFVEAGYYESLKSKLIISDRDLGRLSRLELYKVLNAAKLVISIPISDSSPRSVYEAIFCGCIVAVLSSPWIDCLPPCMSKRVVVVDLQSMDWLRIALESAEVKLKEQYMPSREALDAFDQKRSMLKFYQEIFCRPSL